MPIDPKRALRGIRQQQAAAQQKSAMSAKQQKRRMNQPDQAEAVPESEAAQWVRDNLEWDEHSEIWEIPYTTSGDYVGGYMQKANAKYLMATYPDLFTLVTGGYSSETVGITEEKRLALTDDEFSTVKEIVEGLEDYPSIDDDTTSEVESEARWEYWTEYGRDGVREDLVKKFSDDFLAQLAVCMKTDEFWDEMCREKEWDEHINQDCEGLNMHMRTKDVVDRHRNGVTVDEIMGDEAEVYAFLDNMFQADELADWISILNKHGIYLNSDEEAFVLWKEAERQIGVENLWQIGRPDLQKEPGEAISLEHGALADAAKLIKSTPTDEIVRRAKTRPDDPNQLNFKLESKRIIEDLLAEGLLADGLLAEQETYKLSTTQIDLPKALADHVLKWGRINIKDDDLYYDEDGGCGRESEQHISVLYGLTDAKPSAELKELVRKTKPFTITLGTVSLFENEKYDVVKVGVKSDDLVALSDAIRQACPNENKYAKYVPHVTVAYTKKGKAAKLKEEAVFTRDTHIEPDFEATELLFKGAGAKDGQDRVIVSLPFNRTKNEAIDPKRILRQINSQVAALARPTRLGDVRNGTAFQCDDGRMMRKVGGKTYLISPGGTETLYDIGNDQYLCYPIGWDKATMGSYGRNYSKRTLEKGWRRRIPRFGESARDIIEALDPKRVLINIRQQNPEMAVRDYVAQVPPVHVILWGSKRHGFFLDIMRRDGTNRCGFGPLKSEQLGKLMDTTPLGSVDWEIAPLVMREAVDPKQVLRSIHATLPAAVYPYYFNGRGSVAWVTPDGEPSNAPVLCSVAQAKKLRALPKLSKLFFTDVAIKAYWARNVLEAVVGEAEATTTAEIEKAAAKTEPEPTEKQKETGKYKKGKIELHGLSIAIENAKGSERSGMDKDGKEWKVKMPAIYGFISKTEAKDGDALDVYIGENPESTSAYVVNQRKLEGGFDEVKIMLGFTNKFRAIRCYDRAYSDGLGPKLREEVVATTIDGLKRWIKDGDTTKPFEQLKLKEAVDPNDPLVSDKFGLGALDRNGAVVFKPFPRDTFAAQAHGGDNPTGPYRFRYMEGVLEWSDCAPPTAEQVQEVIESLVRRGFPVLKQTSVYDRAELGDPMEEGLDESAPDPKQVLQAVRNPKHTIKRPTYFKYVPDGYWFRTVTAKLAQKDAGRDPEGIANAYVQELETLRPVTVAPDEACFPLLWRSADITDPVSYRMSDRVKPEWLTPEEAEPELTVESRSIRKSESKRFPFDQLNFPTDPAVLVAKLLDLDDARSKPVL